MSFLSRLGACSFSGERAGVNGLLDFDETPSTILTPKVGAGGCLFSSFQVCVGSLSILEAFTFKVSPLPLI